MTVTTRDVELVAKSSNILIHSKTAVRARVSVYEKENSVAVRHSSMYMGRNKHSDKLWSRWETTEMYVVRRTKTGKFAAFMRTFGKNPKVYANLLPPVSEAGDAIGRLGFNTIADAYPALGVMSRQALTPASLRGVTYITPPHRGERRKFYAALHNDDPRDFVTYLVGTYRKDIARALGYHNTSGFGYIQRAAPEIPVDWLAEALRCNSAPCLESAIPLKRMFDAGHISKVQMRNFLLDGLLPQSYTVQDVYRMARIANQNVNIRELTKGKSLIEIHDELVEITNSRRVGQSYPDKIEYKEEIAKVMNAQVGKYRLVLPTTGDDVIRWGREMNHCIGGYAGNAYGYDLLGAVYDGDDMVANFQIHDKKMIQIFGKNNSIFEDAKEVYDYFLNQDVIEETGYVGGMYGLL